MINCVNCSDCSNCSGFEYNPCRYTSEKMGSRESQTTVYWLSDIVQLVCDFFRGSLKEFEEKVMSVYGNEGHGKDYLGFVEKAKFLIGGRNENDRRKT